MCHMFDLLSIIYACDNHVWPANTLMCSCCIIYTHTCGPLEPAQQQQQKYIGLYSTFWMKKKHSESSSLGW
jgi:hypothetical protein